jgi:hypothetical protein
MTSINYMKPSGETALTPTFYNPIIYNGDVDAYVVRIKRAIQWHANTILVEPALNIGKLMIQ